MHVCGRSPIILITSAIECMTYPGRVQPEQSCTWYPGTRYAIWYTIWYRPSGTCVSRSGYRIDHTAGPRDIRQVRYPGTGVPTSNRASTHFWHHSISGICTAENGKIIQFLVAILPLVGSNRADVLPNTVANWAGPLGQWISRLFNQ